VRPFRLVPTGRTFLDSHAATAKDMVVCSALGADPVVDAKSSYPYRQVPRRQRKRITSGAVPAEFVLNSGPLSDSWARCEGLSFLREA
jgi:hypothetical protein